jgi:hypothetical protein
MFLTGFDATTLNTLFVDKNLRAHGLIQAYSRTNRILNSVKTYGNIVSFRDLEDETNDAIALFGNKDARGVVLLKPYGEYYDEYAEKVTELLEAFPLGSRSSVRRRRRSSSAVRGDPAPANILTSFDDFAGHEMLTARQHQDYRSVYLDLYAEFRKDRDGDKEPINDDVVFEIELIKQVEINVDYILMLVQKYRDQRATATTRRSAPRSPGPSTPARPCATSATSSRTSSTPCRVGRRGVARLRERPPRRRTRGDHHPGRAAPRADPGLRTCGLQRRCRPGDGHRHHQGPAPRIPLRRGRGTCRQEGARHLGPEGARRTLPGAWVIGGLTGPERRRKAPCGHIWLTPRVAKRTGVRVY